MNELEPRTTPAEWLWYGAPLSCPSNHCLGTDDISPVVVLALPPLVTGLDAAENYLHDS
jgi:hypothetical protein